MPTPPPAACFLYISHGSGRGGDPFHGMPSLPSKLHPSLFLDVGSVLTPSWWDTAHPSADMSPVVAVRPGMDHNAKGGAQGWPRADHHCAHTCWHLQPLPQPSSASSRPSLKKTVISPGAVTGRTSQSQGKHWPKSTWAGRNEKEGWGCHQSLWILLVLFSIKKKVQYEAWSLWRL